jgi:tRNA pseudouridine55 synthase
MGRNRTQRIKKREPSLSTLTGILNLNKPIGVTSHDVVIQVRRATGQRRVGHAGTLDPLASGVLLICLGAATRLSDELMAATKVYRATVRFGASSTTDDSEGTLTPVPLPISLGEEEIRAAAARLIGEVDQVPPVYSAIKVAGRPVYERARAGEFVVMTPRRVKIDCIKLLNWCTPDATIEVHCSKGTYVRSIARDLGDALGTAAYLTGLTRLASGSFRISDAVTVDEVSRAAAYGNVDRLLYPIDVAVARWPGIVLDQEQHRRVVTGRQVELRHQCGLGNGLLRAYDGGGKLVALLRFHDTDGSWWPDKVFDSSATNGLA